MCECDIMFESCMVILYERLLDPKRMSGSMYMEECTICVLLASNLHFFSFWVTDMITSEPIISHASS